MTSRKKTLAGVLVLGFGLTAIGLASAADSTTQTVGFRVKAIDEINVSGSPGELVIETATAGSEPDAVSESSTSYDLTTNGTGKKITGAIDSAMPENVTLTVNLQEPNGASSAGAVPLSTTAADLVTAITKKVANNRSITYGLSATVEAGIITSTNRTVTFTIADAT